MKKFTLHLLVLMLVFAIQPAYSQAPSWSRMFQIWTYGLQTGNVLDADADHVYMAGSVSGPVTFNGLDCSSIGNQDMILTKYTNEGLNIWTKQINAQAGGTITPQALKVDAHQNIIVSGSFQGTITIGSSTITSGISANGFIAKFDANGNGLWVSTFVSTGTGLSRIAVDERGDCYLIDRSNKLLKFSASGEKQWEQTYADGTLQAVAVSGFNLFISGSVKGNVSFGNVTLSPSGKNNTGFLLRADLNGVYNHSLLLEGAGLSRGNFISDIVIDQSNNLVITGGYSRELIIGTQKFIQSFSGYYTFIAKCNNDFDVIWAVSSDRIPSSFLSSLTYRLYRDEANNYYEYGLMGGAFQYGAISLSSIAGEFLIKFDENGNALNYFPLKNNTPNTIMVTPKGKVVRTGSINYTSMYSFGNIYLIQLNESMNLDWQVVSSGSQSGIADIRNVKHDRLGNTYLQSRIQGHCNYFGTLIQTNDPVTVISKHDISGKLIWMNQINDINPKLFGSTFILDKDNNVLTVGLFETNLTIGSTTLSSMSAGEKPYVAKYSSNGEFQWASKLNDYGFDQMSLATDNNGNVLVSGVSSPANYLFKIDPSGHQLWEKSFPMESYYCSLISTDANNNIYLTSEIHISSAEGTAIIGSVTLSQNNNDGATAVVKFDPNGNALWAKTYGGVMGASFSEGWPCQIKTDATGNSYIWGISANNSTFGTTKLSNPFETAYPYFYFLAKINTNGEVLWANAVYEKTYSFNDGDLLDLDKNGNIYVGGSMRDSICISENFFKAEGSYDFFLSQYSNEGEFKWIKTIPSDTKIINALSVLDNDSLTVVGSAGKNTSLETFPYTKKGNSTCIVATLGKLSTGTNDIPAILEEGNISLYPNPNKGKFRLDLHRLKTNSENTQLRILDQMGRSIHSTLIKAQESIEIDLSGIPKGMYFLQVHTGETTYIKKMVVN